jgi:hypothetical protein
MNIKEGDEFKCYNCEELKVYGQDDSYSNENCEHIICDNCFYNRCEKCNEEIDNDETILLFSKYAEYPCYCIKCIIKEKYCLYNDLSIYETLSWLDDIISKNKEYKKYKLNPYLQYKINKFKNKLRNNKLNKNLEFKINGKKYNFSSNYFDVNVNTFKKEKKIYSKSNYFEKHKNRISDNDIKKLEDTIKNNDIKNRNFWDNYNKSKNISKNNINKVFENDPIIEINQSLFNEKYIGKHYSFIYKNILSELDQLEKEYNNFKIIENIYNKLKEDVNINTVFKNKNNKINALFSDYENNRINEYKVLLEIGNLFINNKLTKEESKEFNSMNQNSRPARIIRQSKRIYLLEEFVNIKNIALSGISNWLRDTSENNFEILLSFFDKKEEYNIDNCLPVEDYFSDNEPPKNNNITRILFT